MVNQLACKQAHISYRDSKLTFLLKNALGGNSITTIIGCISPAKVHVDESINTMRFCTRTMKIMNKAKVSEVVDQKLKQEQLMVQNRALKLRIADLENQLQVSQSQLMSSGLSTTEDELDLNEISMLLEPEENTCVGAQTSFVDQSEELK